MARNRFSVTAVFVLLIAVFAVIGCNDQSPAPPAPTQDAVLTADIPQELLQEIQELERIAAAPDRGISRFSVDKPVVVLPAGSVDGLAAAIAAAGKKGVVVVEAGLHTESGPVTITDAVDIIGEPGAIMKFDTEPDPNFIAVDPSLHIFHANRVTIWGLDIGPTSAVGNTGVLVEDSKHCTIGNNIMRDLQAGVLIQEGDHAMIWGNTVINVPTGITAMNGKGVRIVNNDVTNAGFGIWACGRKGFLLNNTVHGNFIGILLCKVPAGGSVLPSGAAVGSDFPGERWFISQNNATGNSWGYLAIDGANNNTLENNAASGNVVYDVELSGDSFRFGFLTPRSSDNKVIIADPNIVVKNCGENNIVIGGSLVDNSKDPCN